MNEPITRSEMYLAALGGEAVTPPAPITRMDMYLAYLNGMTDTYPEPITRTEQYLYKLCQNGMGGGGVTIRNQNKTITENGEYTADSGYTGLGVVTVNVAASGGGDDSVILSILDKSITEFTNSKLTYIGESGFLKCTKLTKVDLQNVTKIEAHVFRDCSALKDVNMPLLTDAINNGHFTKTLIEDISLPSLKKLSGSMFQSCSQLKNVYAPKATEIQAFCFEYCTALEKFDAPDVLYQLLASCFKGSGLKTLILRQNTKTVTLQNLNVFLNTVFASGGTGGVLLIPSALVTAYTEATNWSVIYGYGTNHFLALEDYTVDGTVTGEIDWDKVNALFA